MEPCTQSLLPPLLPAHPHVLLPTAALIFFLPTVKFPVAPQGEDQIQGSKMKTSQDKYETKVVTIKLFSRILAQNQCVMEIQID